MKEQLYRVVFWLLWPLVWVYAPLRVRARVLVICGNEFLVVKPYFGSGQWQLPGGGVKFGEGPIAAAERELHEETGLKLGKEKLQELLPLQKYKESGGLLLRYSIFWVRIKSKETIFTKDNEIVEATWLPVDNLNSRVAPHVMTSLEKMRSFLDSTK